MPKIYGISEKEIDQALYDKIESGANADLQKVFENSTNPQIITTPITGAFELQVGSGADTDKLQKWKNTSGTEVASVDGKGHIVNALIPKEISGTYTLLSEDAGRSFIITANTTITIPNGLPEGFNASFSTLTGAILTFSLGVSVVVTGGLVMQAESDCAIIPRATVNNYLTRGTI